MPDTHEALPARPPYDSATAALLERIERLDVLRAMTPQNIPSWRAPLDEVRAGFLIRHPDIELEDAELDLMGQLEETTAERDELATRKKKVEETLRAEVAVRDAEVSKLSTEAKAAAASRASEAEKVPAALLALYEKIREHRGLGAARLHRGRCSGCQLELTISDLDVYRKAPQNEVLRCVECDRILVRTADSGL